MSDHLPLISVILPAYNSARFVEQAVRSVLRQSEGDFELIIIYDQSSDGSKEIIDSLASVDERIQIMHGRGRGLSDALNCGINAARGKYIARMDADDISHKVRFERQIEVLEREGADICGCHWFVINEQNQLIDAKIVPLTCEAITVALCCTVPFAHGSTMIRGDFIRHSSLSYGGVTYAEDYDLWIRMWQESARFANVNEFLYSYRDHNATLSRKNARGNLKDTKRLRRRFIKCNFEATQTAVKYLLKDYARLTETARVHIILATYIIALQGKVSLFLDVLKKSSRRSIGFALLFWYRGF